MRSSLKTIDTIDSMDSTDLMPAALEVRHWQGHHGPLLDVKDGFDVIDCATCGFMHVTPVPTEQELEEIYRHEYYTDEKPLYIERFIEDLDWWNIAYGDRYDSFEQSLPAQRRRLLDIGSGPGYFLKHGKDRGWDVTGVEPSRQAAAHARSLGLTVVEAFLDETLAPTLGQFDVIHLSEVLEHIPDPGKLLRLAHTMLAPGGLLCVVVPNDYSPVQGALREACGFAPWWVAAPHHLNYFSRASLSALTERSGFDVLHTESTFPIDLFLLMGDNYVGNDVLGRACHGKRMRFEKNLARAGRNDVKRALYRALSQIDIGREICLYARKPD